MYWKINNIRFPIYNLGPGKRVGIWVQGCSKKCPGCINPTLWDYGMGQKVNIELLVRMLSYIQEDYQGVTVSGGEPFDQYESLIVFCAFLKKITNLDIYIFTGYTLEELYEKFHKNLFAKYIDFLMDGRYIAEKHDNNNTRGSLNQNLYKFINERPILQKECFKSGQWSINISHDNKIYMSGIPKKFDFLRIKSQLKSVGISVEFE